MENKEETNNHDSYYLISVIHSKVTCFYKVEKNMANKTDKIEINFKIHCCEAASSC